MRINLAGNLTLYLLMGKEVFHRAITKVAIFEVQAAFELLATTRHGFKEFLKSYGSRRCPSAHFLARPQYS